ERIKYCCEQLRILLPFVKGRKNDAASVLEATVDYVKYIREKIPPAVMAQITEALQSNKRFCKKQQTPIQLSLSGTVMAQRENSVPSTYSPGRGPQFLSNTCWNVCSAPNAEGSLDEAVRGPLSSTSENAIGDQYKTHIPSAALSLNSFHTVRYYSKVTPSYDETAVTNQNISIHLPSAVCPVSKLLPQHCTSGLGQTCTTHSNCLYKEEATRSILRTLYFSSLGPMILNFVQVSKFISNVFLLMLSLPYPPTPYYHSPSPPAPDRPRENSVPSTYSPGRGTEFLSNTCWNVCSAPNAEGSLDEAVRGPLSSTSENAIGDQYYSKVTPSYDETAVTNQNISIHLPSAVCPVSKLLPQHCTSRLGQTCTTHSNC
ncbi:Spermatogenesis- and oogenesis-specific basic helix-loop-helix-containing protein 2, partial [Plecturocebus cupreus]